MRDHDSICPPWHNALPLDMLQRAFRRPWGLPPVKSFLLALLGLSCFALVACGGDGEEIILATTTSTQDSGLLDELVPAFVEDRDITVKVIAVGTGAALEMAASGDSDAVLAHSPSAEQEYVDSGDLAEGLLVMHNDFVIVGPADDPAGAAGAAGLAAAMAAIAETGPFISRGDESGTHSKELSLWREAGVDPAAVNQREETGQGMGATLNVANEKRAYTLADRATWLALRDNLSELDIVFEGAGPLLNIYHGYIVNPEKHPGAKAGAAREWNNWLVSEEAQAIIETFGVEEYGEPLFVPGAGKSIEELGN
jgi:tungstate transport system substrate-binding protein